MERSAAELKHHTIPAAATSFVGRVAELDELRCLLAAGRLLTISGAGGVGKTRLAMQLARHFLDDLPGGAWWCDLGQVTDAESVADAIASGCRTVVSPGTTLIDAIRRRLGSDSDSLVVIDNAEHHLDAVARIAREILAATTTVRLVVTSREPLGVPGEQVWRAASMSIPPPGASRSTLDGYDASRLFIERAHAVRPNLVISTEAEEVASICRRLDGIPLALELAAARTRAMSLTTLDQRLQESFRLLTGAGRGVASRQATVEASIRWSSDLLDSADKAVLRRISVHHAPFDLDSAEAVAADDPSVRAFERAERVDRLDVIDALARLVDKSLVEFDPATGLYRLLEATRQFALTSLHDHDEIATTRHRHATYWSDRATREAQLTSAEIRLDAIQPHLTDVIAALDWWCEVDPDRADALLGSIALTVFGMGRWTQLHRACDWLVARRPRGPSWPAAAAAIGVVAALVGRLDAVEAVAEALADGSVGDDPQLRALLAVGPAYAHLTSGQVRPALAQFDDAVANKWEIPAFLLGTAISLVASSRGDLRTIDRCTDAVSELFPAPALHSSTAIGPSRCRAAIAQGDFKRAYELLAKPSNAWTMMSMIWATTYGQLGVATGDATLIADAVTLIRHDDTPGASGSADAVAWASAVVRRDLAEALARLGVSEKFGVVESSTLDHVDLDIQLLRMRTFVASGQWFDATRVADAVDASRDHAESMPAIDAAVALARGWRAWAEQNLVVAEREAHAALNFAWEADLRLVTLDALEFLAVVLSEGESGRAVQILAAAVGSRARLGEAGLLRSPPILELESRLRSEASAVWIDSQGVELERAVELVRRSRGRRGRPTFGVDALTPTEELVARLCAQGRTNAEIATELVVTVSTVKTHLSRIFPKIGARNRAELVAKLGEHSRPR